MPHANISFVTTAFAPRPRLWDRADYDRLVDAGVFGPADRVELLEGEIIEMTPERSRHAAAVDLALETLRRAVGASHTIRVQHPVSAALVVEVSDTSLEYDRTRKSRVYAQAGIAEYWIVNVVEGVLEVHRDPGAQGYRSVSTLHTGETVSPLAATGVPVAVADLLP